MSTEEQFELAAIVTRNRIDARWFLPFTIYRLQPHTQDGSVSLRVQMINIRETESETIQLKLTWSEEFGLEVSGTMGTDVTYRHQVKVRQLLQSPRQPVGYVSVTGFQTLVSIFSQHLQEEAVLHE